MFKMRKWINIRKKQGDGHTDRKILELSTEEISIKATRIVKFFTAPQCSKVCLDSAQFPLSFRENVVALVTLAWAEQAIRAVR